MLLVQHASELSHLWNRDGRGLDWRSQFHWMVRKERVELVGKGHSWKLLEWDGRTCSQMPEMQDSNLFLREGLRITYHETLCGAEVEKDDHPVIKTGC